jgi:hypothetical protein
LGHFTTQKCKAVRDGRRKQLKMKLRKESKGGRNEREISNYLTGKK